MDDKDLVFCTRCGAKISPNTVFCPECGAQVAVIPQQTTEEYYRNNPAPTQSNTMLWAKILLILYGVLALLTGFMLVGLAQWSIDTLEATDPASLKSLLDSLGMTKDEYMNFCTIAGIVYTISGALALISGVMCFKKRYNKIATVLCIIASLVCFVQLVAIPSNELVSNTIFVTITVIIGLVVAYLIYKVRDEFED